MPESQLCPGPLPNGGSTHRLTNDTKLDALTDFEHPMGIEAVRSPPSHDVHGVPLSNIISVATYLRSNNSLIHGTRKAMTVSLAALVQEGGQGLDRLDLRLLCWSREATCAFRGGTRLLAAIVAQRSPRCTRGRRSCHV